MAQIVRLYNNIVDNRNPDNHHDDHHPVTNCRSTSGTGSSSSTGRARAYARTCAGAREGHADHLRDPAQMTGTATAMYEAYQEAISYYEQSTGNYAGPTLHRDIRDAVMQGCSAEVIIACMQEAEAAPRPSWAYARAILRRCLASRILTGEDWERDRARHTAIRTPAGAGAQRTYTPEDFARLYTDLGLDDED